jgi:hypothetical protein
MTPKQFNAVAKELFGETLGEFGFTSERSSYSVFYRPAENGVWHVISADQGTRGAWYDVKVFATCECLEPEFEKRFPDELGIPMDANCYLSSIRGISVAQEQFNCKSEENFRSRYEKTVKSLLINKAVPYLAQFNSLESILPHIRNPFYEAVAMFRARGIDQARPLLMKQRERLDSAPQDDVVNAATRLLDSLLAS